MTSVLTVHKVKSILYDKSCRVEHVHCLTHFHISYCRGGKISVPGWRVVAAGGNPFLKQMVFINKSLALCSSLWRKKYQKCVEMKILFKIYNHFYVFLLKIWNGNINPFARFIIPFLWKIGNNCFCYELYSSAALKFPPHFPIGIFLFRLEIDCEYRICSQAVGLDSASSIHISP